MRIDLNKNPNILREPKNHADALARRAEILALFEGTGYDSRENGLYKKATQQIHELLAAKLELEAQQEYEAASSELQMLTPKERHQAEIHKRALIAQYAKNAPKERVPETHVVVTESEPAGVPVTVNIRDEVLTPSDVAGRSI